MVLYQSKSSELPNEIAYAIASPSNVKCVFSFQLKIRDVSLVNICLSSIPLVCECTKVSFYYVQFNSANIYGSRPHARLCAGDRNAVCLYTMLPARCSQPYKDKEYRASSMLSKFSILMNSTMCLFLSRGVSQTRIFMPSGKLRVKRPLKDSARTR